MFKAELIAALELHCGPLLPEGTQRVSGGSINQCFSIQGRHGSRYFVKTHNADQLEMFVDEADGLGELASARAVKVPAVVATGIAGSQAYLLLENLNLGEKTKIAAERLGQQLAEQHRHVAERFGWQRDNRIGLTRQPNTQNLDWMAFWRDQRLGYQLRLAEKNSHGDEIQRQGHALLRRLPDILTHAPPASLLHGDLWGGNWGVSADKQPVIFDPAVYYGDREAELAMTRLFGGFPASFYAAYENTWPLPPGHEKRGQLYQLYHVLNHLNLFGRSYAPQALAIFASLLA